jgi:hypothetical protein
VGYAYGRGEGNWGDEGEEIWLMIFLCIHDIEFWNLLQLF